MNRELGRADEAIAYCVVWRFSNHLYFLSRTRDHSRVLNNRAVVAIEIAHVAESSYHKKFPPGCPSIFGKIVIHRIA